MRKNRIKIIFICTLFVLTISIITCLSLTQKKQITKNTINNFTPIITKQPNLQSIVKDANEKKIEEQRKAEEEKRKIEEEQRKAEEEARRKAEEDKKRNEDAKRLAEEKRNESEARRIAEEKRKAEEARRIAEENKKKAQIQTNNNTTTIDCSKQDNYQKELLCYVNKARIENGLKALTLNNELSNSASIRANEIKTSFAHTRPNGESYSSVIKISHRYSGENIAAGQTNTKQVFDAWMNSPGHRANILSPNYTQMGISLQIDSSVRYKYYWAQLFIS